MKFTLTLAAVLAAVAQASAQSLTYGPGTFSYAGSGCPQGSGVTLSVSSTQVDYTPATFTATSSPITDSRKNCQVNIPVTIQANWQFRVVDSDVPVTVSHPSGNSAIVTSTTYFSGVGGTGTASTTYTSSGSFTANNVYSPTNVWSPCGGSALLNINTALRAAGSGLGTVSTAGPFTSDLAWQPC